ncbi:NfeD family protein [bacterium]|nr:NfeD family protein [bacterium]
MTVWQFCLCAGLAFLIAEIFIPLTFFLSMSIGAFVTALVAVWFLSKTVLIPVFAMASLLSLLIFRPLLAKNQKVIKENETGVEGKYLGKIVKAIKKIDDNEGAISIYGERWEARSANSDEVFDEGTDVEIVKNDSLVMYVQKASK